MKTKRYLSPQLPQRSPCNVVMLALLLSLLVIFAPATSFGQVDDPYGPSTQEQAANIVFDKANPLVEQGNYAEALTELDKSLDLYRSPYTLKVKARCLVELGRNVAAKKIAEESATLANVEANHAKDSGDYPTMRAKRELAKEAMALAARAATRIAMLTLVVPDALANQAPTILYQRIGTGKPPKSQMEELPTDKYGKPVDVDAGRYRIVATSKLRKSWSANVEVPTNQNTVMVLRALEAMVVQPVDHSHKRRAEGPTAQQLAGIAVATIGGIASLSGAIMGIAAETDDFRTQALAVVGIGSASGLLGTLLWFTGQPSQDDTNSAHAHLGVGPTSIEFRVAF